MKLVCIVLLPCLSIERKKVAELFAAAMTIDDEMKLIDAICLIYVHTNNILFAY